MNRNQYMIRIFATVVIPFACLSLNGQEVEFNAGTPAQVASPGFDSSLVLGAITIYSGDMVLDNGGVIVDASKFTYYGDFGPESGTLGISDAIANGAITNSNTNAASYIGWIENSNTQYEVWRGVDMSEPAIASMTDPVLIGDTYPGDLFMQGTPATNYELSVMQSNINSAATNTTWSDGDSFYQGSVSQSEYSAAIAAEGQPSLYYVDGYLPESDYTPAPEPGSLSLLIVAGLLCRAGTWLRTFILKSLWTAPEPTRC